MIASDNWLALPVTFEQRRRVRSRTISTFDIVFIYGTLLNIGYLLTLLFKCAVKDYYKTGLRWALAMFSTSKLGIK